MDLTKDTPQTAAILRKIKDLENAGYFFEAADGSLELLMKKELGQYRQFFELAEFRVIIENRGTGGLLSSAIIKVRVDGRERLTVAEGDGPVNALDQALRKALYEFYPQLKDVHLTDFKVRVLDADQGTGARVRVLIETRDAQRIWGTVGVSTNLIEAAWDALVDSIEYRLLKDAERAGAVRPASLDTAPPVPPVAHVA